MQVGGNHSFGLKKKQDLQSLFKSAAVNGELDLSNKSLSDMHSAELAKCIKFNSGHIKHLNISKNRISDEGFQIIAKALCESSLEQVNLSNNKITEKCIDQIVGTLKTNKSLKMLDL